MSDKKKSQAADLIVPAAAAGSAQDGDIEILRVRAAVLVKEVKLAQANLEDVLLMLRRLWEEKNSPTITCGDGAYAINADWWRRNHPDRFPAGLTDEQVKDEWGRLMAEH